MISRHDNCLLVHVPKTAGQSIEHFFLERAGLGWHSRDPFLLKYNPNPERGPERLAHLTAEEYLQFGYLTPDEFDSMFKFAFVRNPWAKIVSEYRWGRSTLKYSFREFVLRGLPEPNPYSDDYRHVMPQYRYLYDDEGTLLVDVVGRFETLQNDFDRICERLGIANTKLPHVNASESGGSLKKRLRRILAGLREPFHDHYTGYFDDETREHVADLYSRDIELFGYTFGE